MENWELTARLEVADLLADYTRLSDTGRLDEFAALFGEDGVFEEQLGTGHRMHKGERNIRAYCDEIVAEFKTAPNFLPVRHHISSVAIVVASPDRATARSYFLTLTPAGPDHWGIYRDRLHRTGDRWLFEHRLADIEMAVEGSPVHAIVS